MIADCKGECVGIRFVPRGKDDNHIIIKLLVEDDGNWYESGSSMNSYWLKDLIKVCKQAKVVLDSKAKREDFGYKFKGSL